MIICEKNNFCAGKNISITWAGKIRSSRIWIIDLKLKAVLNDVDAHIDS